MQASGVKNVDFSLVLCGFWKIGKRLREASEIKNVDISLVLEAFWVCPLFFWVCPLIFWDQKCLFFIGFIRFFEKHGSFR